MCQIENRIKYLDADLVVYKVFLTVKWEDPVNLDSPPNYWDYPNLKKGFFPPYHPAKAEFFIGETYEEKELEALTADRYSTIGKGFIHCFKELESAKDYLNELPMDNSVLVVGQCTIPKGSAVFEGITQITVDSETSKDGSWRFGITRNYETYATRKIRLDKVCYVPIK